MKPELLLSICLSGYEPEVAVLFTNTLFLFAMHVVGAYMLFSFMELSSAVLLTLLFLIENWKALFLFNSIKFLGLTR